MNWLPIILGAVSACVLAFIWYNPKVFGGAWMNALGITEEKAKEVNMGLAIGLSLVLAVVLGVFMNNNVQDADVAFHTFKHGAFHGALVGLLVGMPIMVTNALWEQRNFKYMLVNIGYWVVALAVIGGFCSAMQGGAAS